MIRTCTEWKNTSKKWECPVCWRTKEEILRPDKNGDLMGILHQHHDHIADFWPSEFGDLGRHEVFQQHDGSLGFWLGVERFVERFGYTLVCQDCNIMEGRAKSEIACPGFFSFTWQEISAFIIVKPNQNHIFDLPAAEKIWSDQRTDYGRRLDFMRTGAKAIMTKRYWHGATAIEPRWQESDAA